MQRRQFIKASCIACMTGFAFSTLLEGCSIISHINAEIHNGELIIPLSAFQLIKNKQQQFKKYIVVQNSLLQYPICVYRFDEKNYSALWMRCSHQGAELQVFGDKLQCPAHGSEFSNTGEVMSSPASQPLRKFPVTIELTQIKILLT